MNIRELSSSCRGDLDGEKVTKIASRADCVLAVNGKPKRESSANEVFRSTFDSGNAFFIYERISKVGYNLTLALIRLGNTLGEMCARKAKLDNLVLECMYLRERQDALSLLPTHIPCLEYNRILSLTMQLQFAPSSTLSCIQQPPPPLLNCHSDFVSFLLCCLRCWPCLRFPSSNIEVHTGS